MESVTGVSLLFNIFISDNEIECTLSKFASGSKMGDAVDAPDGMPSKETWKIWRIGLCEFNEI